MVKPKRVIPDKGEMGTLHVSSNKYMILEYVGCNATLFYFKIVFVNMVQPKNGFTLVKEGEDFFKTRWETWELALKKFQELIEQYGSE